MPLSLWPARLGCLTLALFAVPSAHAVDGTITINGNITDQTCKINGKTPPADFIVNLPKISKAALKNKGDTAGATLFTIEISECPEALTGQVKAHFEPGVTTDYASGTLFAYTPATGTDTGTAAAPVSSIPSRDAVTRAKSVRIQLANTDGSAINIGAEDSKAASTLLSKRGTGTTTSATLRYLARYYRGTSDAVESGKLLTYIQYSIVYP